MGQPEPQAPGGSQRREECPWVMSVEGFCGGIWGRESSGSRDAEV